MSTRGNPTLVSQTEVSTASGGGGPTPQDDLAVRESATAGLPALWWVPAIADPDVIFHWDHLSFLYGAVAGQTSPYSRWSDARLTRSLLPNHALLRLFLFSFLFLFLKSREPRLMLRGLRPWQRFAVTSSSLRPQLPVAAMSTSASNLNNGLGSFSVSCPPGLSKEDLSRFPAFRVWFATLQRSLSRQKDPSHEFHKDPYLLRKIEVQAVDFFQGGRLGFVKLRAEISNAGGESLPGSVFLRGGSVGMLLLLQPHDVPSTEEDDKWAVLTVQPRIPAGSLAFSEIPAGMLDDSVTGRAGRRRDPSKSSISIPRWQRRVHTLVLMRETNSTQRY
ncbi:hypothetical protein AN7712.2 [Aspergillus nidulans FGSC A4]|uniref:NUDIX family hydrolase, putative (AFU_orthologue AFUA_5G08235) n=1 Tax=Emericella nidulans (strain FGSC A4 / ATCC 38163 / CBS 112.46 / NRRL 194 / M139) TaxID=227321 RepID=Q5AVG8_EMENI|nr:hypothetical protein [Aspergillus nidulans FGSC A4]EAA61227.1 hypothetical protein AN7712.2 [Aspergillus nidulans FGSC A4]CBF79956.1 TPA: NUDIX family hydrolase, putative (AFU_orthologue; AFUA_5G08235) [Aspergillus nidulans FGSC A4]|eukprot:XP_680981.1 hypothetical protein AN7712.2 [Aspergillus nidulans FGSC A4]